MDKHEVDLWGFDKGVPFKFVDSWRGRQDAHREPKRPWHGYTMFFQYECPDPDEYGAQLCSMMGMPTTPKVQFNEKANVYMDVVPYSETYHVHPHFTMAACNDTKGPRWKALPARSDYFTGKSSTVMAARRLALSKSKTRGPKKRRQAIVARANAELQQVQALGASTTTLVSDHLPDHGLAFHDRRPLVGGSTGPSPFKAGHSGGEYSDMGDAMDVDYDNALQGLPSGVLDPYTLSAARTKPEHNNKFKKRLGAKKTKTT